MSEHYPHIRRYSDGPEHSLLIRESVGIIFYMRRPHQEVAQAVLRSVEVYLRAVGPQALLWYCNPYTTDWDELDDKGWEYNRHEMLKAPATSLWLSERPDATTGYEIDYEGHMLDEDEASTVSFFLPTEYLEEHGPGRVRELALELAAGLPFNSGHAGLAMLFPEFLLGTTEAIREPCLRYPGLHISAVQGTSWSIGTRLNGVHWMNFLGQPVLGYIGGTEGLRTRLHSPGTTVQELDEGRALVTLGTWPEAGDLEQSQTLPAYRELARVLEPWLYMRKMRWGGFSAEDMRRWERRFLD
jgi:hypothetical protein